MNKRYSRLLCFVLFLFVCLFLLLCFHSRLATDDYFFIWDVRNHGVITGVTSQYMKWCGRFAATFFMDIFYKWFDVHDAYYSFIPLTSAFLLFLGTNQLLNNITVKLLLQIPTIQKHLAAGCFTALLFFLSIDIGESWFWFCGLSSYLWSIIAFVWGMAFLMSSKNTFLSGFAAVFCFAYAGGSSEVYSVIFGLFLTVIFLFNYKRAGSFRIFLNDTFNKKLVAAYLTFGISFIVFLIAPGNYLRDGLFPEHEFLYSFFITAKSFVKFGIFYLPFKLPYIIAFAFPFMIIGNSLRIFDIPLFSITFKTFFYRITLAFALLLFLFFYMVAYVMVETGPPRIWLLVSFLLAIYCCSLSVYAGYKILFSPAHIKIIKVINITAAILLLSYSLVDQYAIASKYAKAYDERVELITGLNKTIDKDTLLKLAPLPCSGMLYSAEISSDTTHFTNKELRLGYDLKYHVAVNR